MLLSITLLSVLVLRSARRSISLNDDVTSTSSRDTQTMMILRGGGHIPTMTSGPNTLHSWPNRRGSDRSGERRSDFFGGVRTQRRGVARGSLRPKSRHELCIMVSRGPPLGRLSPPPFPGQVSSSRSPGVISELQSQVGGCRKHRSFIYYKDIACVSQKVGGFAEKTSLVHLFTIENALRCTKMH